MYTPFRRRVLADVTPCADHARVSPCECTVRRRFGGLQGAAEAAGVWLLIEGRIGQKRDALGTGAVRRGDMPSVTTVIGLLHD